MDSEEKASVEGRSERLKELHTKIWDGLTEAQAILDHAQEYHDLQREAEANEALATQLRRKLDIVMSTGLSRKVDVLARTKVMSGYDPSRWDKGVLIRRGNGGAQFRFQSYDGNNIYMTPASSKEKMCSPRTEPWHLVDEEEV
jgi:hypothetical protein